MRRNITREDRVNIVLVHGILGFSHLDIPLAPIDYFAGLAGHDSRTPLSSHRRSTPLPEYQPGPSNCGKRSVRLYNTDSFEPPN
jgi:hypothetical protein